MDATKRPQPSNFVYDDEEAGTDFTYDTPEAETPTSFVYDEEPETAEEAPLEPGSYSIRDISGGQLVKVRDYMRIMEGGKIDQWGDEELLDKYINRQRSFAAGNSVTTVREFSRLKSLSDEDLAIVGEAYNIFNNAKSALSDPNERWEAIGDYAYSAVVDPINLVGLGIGKAVAVGTTKSAVRVAQKKAMQAYTKKLAEKGSKEKALEAGQKVFHTAIKEAGKSQGKELTAREVARKAGKRKVRTEVGTAVAVDAAAAVGIDLAYQNSMIKTGAQEEWNPYMSGVAGLGTLALGGAAYALSKGSSNVSIFDPSSFTPDPKSSAEVTSTLFEGVTTPKVKETNEWLDKVSKGKELKDLDFEFWRTMLLGNDDLGIKGMAQILPEKGYVWQRRTPYDKVSNWIADIIKTSDPLEAEKFVKAFESKTGVKMTALKGEMKLEGVEAFAHVFAKKMNEAGTIQNAASQIAKARGLTVESVQKQKLDTLANYAEALALPTPKQKSTFDELGPRGYMRFQDNTIRMLVSNPSTTALNVIGYGAYAGQTVASDLMVAALHSGDAGLKFFTGNITGSKESLKAVRIIAENTRERLRFMLDPETSADVFRSYALARPEGVRELTETIPGGVEDISTKLRDQGFDPNRGFKTEAMDDFVDGIQTLNLVKSQDVITKSFEFNTQLDKALRVKYGMGLREFSVHPKRREMMATEDFARIEAKAAYETARAVFSKSFKDQSELGRVAGIIEDARSIPGVGLLVPFGRFFNNTIAMLADSSGASLVAKAMGKGTDLRSNKELFARATVTWVGVGILSEKEAENRELGLAWSESLNTDGSVTDHRWNFPYSLWKGAAHLMSFWRNGEDIPPELLKDIGQVVEVAKKIRLGEEIPPELIGQIGKDVFGQLTRQLDESADGVIAIAEGILRGEISAKDLNVLPTIASQMVSGWTRFLEPVNVAVGLAKTADFEQMDRKQGNKLINDSFRL